MKKYILIIISLFLIFSCSKDKLSVKIDDEEEINFAPNDFDASINGVTFVLT